MIGLQLLGCSSEEVCILKLGLDCCSFGEGVGNCSFAGGVVGSHVGVAGCMVADGSCPSLHS